MAVNDVYEVVIGGRVRGEWCESTIHLREEVASLLDIPSEGVASSVDTVWCSTLAPLLSLDEAVLDCIYARRIAPTPGVPWTRLINRIGEVVGDALPSNSAVVVSWVTALGGGRKRGRNYIYGISEAYQNGGNLVIGARTDLETWVSDLMALWGPGGASSYRLCVWSALNVTAQDVIGGIVRTNLGVMRSRRPRPGIAS